MKSLVNKIFENQQNIWEVVHYLIEHNQLNNEFSDYYLKKINRYAIKQIAKRIKDEYDSDERKECEYSIYFNQNLYTNCYLKSFSKIGIPWLHQLNVFYVFDTEEDNMVLTDTAEFVYNNITQTFNRIDVKLSVCDKRANYIDLYSMNDENVYVASVLLKINKREDLTHIEHILWHELNHIYDMFKYQVSQDRMNKDVLFNKFVGIEPHELREEYGQILKWFKNTVYYINWSELHSRVFQMLEDLSRYTIDEIYIRQITMKDSGVINLLYQKSKTFREYYQIYCEMNDLSKDTSNSTKIKFVKNCIIPAYGKRTLFNEYVYDTDFKINGVYTEESFDLFFEYHANKIYDNFINKCIRVYVNILKDADEIRVEENGGFPYRCGLTEGTNNGNELMKTMKVGELPYVKKLLDLYHKHLENNK